MFGNISEMYNRIKVKNSEYGLSRMIAGYSWRWYPKKEPNAYDIDNIKFK